MFACWYYVVIALFHWQREPCHIANKCFSITKKVARASLQADFFFFTVNTKLTIEIQTNSWKVDEVQARLSVCSEDKYQWEFSLSLTNLPLTL